MSQFEHVASLDELAPGKTKSILVDDEPALLVRVGDEYFAVEDMCTHDGQPLDGGPVEDGAIVCSRHGAKFDLKTGAALCMPATEGVACLPVEVRDDGVYVGPPSASETTATAPAPETAAAPSADAPAAAADGTTGEATPAATAPGSMPDDSALIEALKQVIDPELMINVVDLGLVYNVETHEDARVSVDMTLTSPACPAGPQIMQQAQMALQRLDGVETAEIKLTMTPPWTPERMTDDARDQLGIF